MKVCWRCGEPIAEEKSLCAACEKLPPIVAVGGSGCARTLFGSPLLGKIIEDAAK